MADNTQNPGGQQGQHGYGGKADDGREQNDQKKKIEKQGGEPATNIWHKIQHGAAAKEKMGDFKQQLDSQPKKKRRRRRRKKGGVGEVSMSGVQQQVHKPKEIEQPKRQVHQAESQVHLPKHVDKAKQQNDQVQKNDLPVNKFEDEDQNAFQEITPFADEEEPESVEEVVNAEKTVVSEPVTEEVELVEDSKSGEADEPVFEEPQTVAAKVEPTQDVGSVPEEVKPDEKVESVAEEIETTPEEPNPPVAPVAPINPFDFNPEPQAETQVATEVEPETESESESESTPESVPEPSLPSSTYRPPKPANPFKQEEPEDKQVKPINPFDLADSANIVEPMIPADQAVEEEEEVSPEATGESDEFQAVNTGDSVETPNRDDDEKVEKKTEVIEVKAEEIKERKIEPVFPDNLPNDSQGDNAPFKDDFWTVLEHAGITKKKLIVFGVIIAVLLVGGLFFIFGGMKLFSSSGDEVAGDVVKKSESDKIPTQIKADPIVDANQRPYDIISSYIFGLEFKPVELIQALPITSFGNIGGVDSALIFGKIINLKEEQFVEYVKILEQMNNIYNVDIYNMLNLAVDRRAALNKYLMDMDALVNNATAALANIQAHLLQLNEQYDVVSKQVTAYETAFSGYVRNYYGQTSYDNLQLFMDTSNQAARMKAQYGAENILRTMFINSLNALKPRYQDVSSNTEALIQGVKVFDIKNSNINAIIPIQ